MPVRQKSIECWVLGIESFEYWVLNVGYTVIFPMPSQAKKYEYWVLGIGHWVLGIEQFTMIFQYPVSQKHRMFQFFSNTQYPIPKIRGPTGKTALWLLVGFGLRYFMHSGNYQNNFPASLKHGGVVIWSNMSGWIKVSSLGGRGINNSWYFLW